MIEVGDPAPITVRRETLDGLQYLRATAACLVVLFHAATIVGARAGAPPAAGLLAVGHRGVELFFVLSGFIIFYVHYDDRPTSTALVRYARRRFIRVVPLTFLIATAVAIAYAPRGLSTFSSWTSSALLVPHTAEPAPSVIWTLKHELFFYALFALMFLDRRLGLLAVAMWAGICLVAGGLALSGDLFTRTLLSRLNLLFLFGALTFFAWRRLGRPATTGPVPFLAALAVFAVVTALLDHTGPTKHTSLAVLPIGLAAAVVVLSASWTRPTQSPIGRAVRFLGGASFAIYLVHYPVLGFCGKLLWPRMPQPELLLAALVLLAIGVSLVVHLAVERPLLASLAGWGRHPRVPGLSTAVDQGSGSLAASPRRSSRFNTLP
jgi:peptidoglycan/LPS O-acetylase OafA/YrhL